MGRPALLAGLLLSVVCAVGLWTWPVEAAVRIDYFQTFTFGNLLRLEWKTAEENDLAAFQIYCKEEAEPNSAYHLIGTRWAQGSADEGAVYTFDIAAGLEPGVAYCFRLEELTIDNRRGEILDYCGYGLNITPADLTPTLELLSTATVTPTVTSTVAITTTGLVTATATTTATNTVVVPEIIVVNTPAPVSTAITPTAIIPTAVVVVPTLETPPTVMPTATMTDTVTVVTPTVIPTTTTTLADTVNTEPEEETEGENGGIVVIPTEAATATPENAGASQPITVTQTAEAGQNSPLPTPTLSTTSTPTATLSDDSQTTVDGATDLALSSVGGGSTAAIGAEETRLAEQNVAPVPPYIVLTATPRGLQPEQTPTFTPFPTMIAVAEGNLLATTIPTSQNLMLLLLCGIFSGASGLGILGVVTTLLYMRSRSAEDRNAGHR